MCARWSGRESPGFAMISVAIIPRGCACDGVAFPQTNVIFIDV